MATSENITTEQPFYQWDDNGASDRQTEWDRQIKEASCDPSVATICEHDPKSARFTLSNGAEIIERAMCNGATDVSIADGREMTEAERQEYCQTVIPVRWREVN